MPGRSRRTLTTAVLLLLLGHIAPALAQEAPRAGPYRVGGAVSRPEIVSQTRPVYTELARRNRVTGTVIVEAVIDEQGTVTDVRVLKGLPMGLDRSAVEAIKTWKFKPATLEGRPVPVYYVLTVNFQVDDSPRYGPVFEKFLQQNLEFADHFAGKRYAEAAALLDRGAADGAADSEIPLARAVLHLEQGRFEDAWQAVLDYRGPGPYEILFQIAALAAIQASPNRNLDAASRAEAIEIGLEAAAMALAAQPESQLGIAIKLSLLRLKATLTEDPAERESLLAEAQQLEKLMIELRQRQEAGTAPEPRLD
jgi:TonB family protein